MGLRAWREGEKTKILRSDNHPLQSLITHELQSVRMQKLLQQMDNTATQSITCFIRAGLRDHLTLGRISDRKQSGLRAL